MRMINQENAEGSLVGCNHYQEWLLPWWWQGYLTHNHYPVAFADFGMSERAKAWCRQRGELISLNLTCDFITPKEQIDDARIQMWSQIYSSNLWPSRSSWFKKPFALLQAPFKSAIWIDLDCEIHGCLAPLFEYCDNPCGIAVAQEFDFVQEKERSVGLILHARLDA